MEKREHGLANCHLSKTDLVWSFLTVGLEQPIAAQRGQRWGWALNGSWGCIGHPKCFLFTAKDWFGPCVWYPSLEHTRRVCGDDRSIFSPLFSPLQMLSAIGPTRS